MELMFFEVGGILYRNFQENYGHQKLLNMALVRTSRGQFCKMSEDSRNQRAREVVSKLRQKPTTASQVTKIDNKLELELQDY